jgi:heme oxygenase (biliverdin-IX-beta and delta-forming)
LIQIVIVGRACALDAATGRGLTAAMTRIDDDDPALFSRRLARRCDRAALATSLTGAPYASLVLLAHDHDASPLLLLSDLAQHSRNIAAEPRVSLLLDGTAGYSDPLAGPRLSIQGRAAATADPDLLARFTSRHPASAGYAGFGDFRLYRVAVERAHLVAGFGRIRWVDGADFRFADGAALAGVERAVLDHMNADHADALALYATRLLGRSGDGWRMTGIDPEGIDLRREGEIARLDFPAPVTTAAAVRQALVRLADEARRHAPV